jgi:hypothetical protein
MCKSLFEVRSGADRNARPHAGGSMRYCANDVVDAAPASQQRRDVSAVLRTWKGPAMHVHRVSTKRPCSRAHRVTVRQKNRSHERLLGLTRYERQGGRSWPNSRVAASANLHVLNGSEGLGSRHSRRHRGYDRRERENSTRSCHPLDAVKGSCDRTQGEFCLG